jgi:hypothetical protein
VILVALHKTLIIIYKPISIILHNFFAFVEDVDFQINIIGLSV